MKLISELDSKLKLLQLLPYEDPMYWKVADIYGRKEFEIVWYSTASEYKWTIKPEGQSPIGINTEGLEAVLNLHKIDMHQFDLQLSSHLLQAIIISKQILDEGIEVFGKEIVDEAEKEITSFMDSLTDIVKDALGLNTPKKEEKKTVLQLLKPQKDK